MAWFKRFVDPIVVPDGRELLTLRDAAEYITALAKAEQDAADWQVAMENAVCWLPGSANGPDVLARNRDNEGIEPRRRPGDANAMTEIGFSARIDPWVSNQWDLFRQGNQKKAGQERAR